MTRSTNTIFSNFDELFELATSNTAAHAKSDITLSDGIYAVNILLPGFTKEEVAVRAEGNDLIIEAQTKRKFPRFLSDKVRKTYQVDDLDADSIAAKLEAGILCISFSTAQKRNAKSINVL